jgi:two-component system aerobic respiration control sensor histidine kinase ArcB
MENIDSLACRTDLFEELFKQISGYIVYKDRDGTIISYNDHFQQFHDIHSSFTSLTDYDIYHHEEADILTLMDREALRTLQGISREIVIEKYNQKIPLLMHTAPFFHKEKLIGTTTIFLKMKQNEKIYEGENKLFNDFFKMLPGLAHWKGLDNRYIGCNAAYAKTQGLSKPEDIINKLSHSNVPKDIGDVLRAADKALMDEQKSRTQEEFALKEDGSQGVFLTKKTPIYDFNGKVAGLLSVSFDITHRKEQEKELRIAKEDLERANTLKLDFMSNMEHDIRSPFSAIATFCTWLRDEEQDSYKKQVLADVVDSSEELLKLCNDMLDFSKLEKEPQPHLKTKFELSVLIDKIYRLERIVASAKNIEFHVDYDPSIPEVLLGDHFRVYRILINILSNAFKFTHEGTVLLSVECLRKNYKEALIRFTIKDTGIGMPIEKQHYIFEKFSKLTRSHHGLHKGLGIGLSIVKQYMHDLEGEIDLVCEEGKGTMIACTVLLHVPLTNDFIDKSFIHKLSLD